MWGLEITKLITYKQWIFYWSVSSDFEWFWWNKPPTNQCPINMENIFHCLYSLFHSYFIIQSYCNKMKQALGKWDVLTFFFFSPVKKIFLKIWIYIFFNLLMEENFLTTLLGFVKLTLVNNIICSRVKHIYEISNLFFRHLTCLIVQ